MISLHILLPDGVKPLNRELHFQVMPRVGDHLMLDLNATWSPFLVRKIVHATLDGQDTMRTYLVVDAEAPSAARHDPPPARGERAGQVEWWHKLGSTSSGRLPPR